MYWDPFEEIERMHEEMDRLFRRSFYGNDRALLENKGEKGELSPWNKNIRTPMCHMHETENNIVATFELPGVEKSDIQLNVDDFSVEVKVELKKEKKHEDKEKQTYGYSMQTQSFYRRLPLLKEVDSSKATAEYKDSILRVEMPKKEKGKGRALQIK